MKIENKNNTSVGVIVARFQSPYLHEGHQDIIKQVLANHPRVLVYLGLSPVKCSKNNPLDFATRKAMIAAVFPTIEVNYIEDIGDNTIWSKNLDRHIAKIVGANAQVVLYGSRDSFIVNYNGKYPTIELVPNKFFSSKEIRKNIGVATKNTQEFREGVVWAVENQYPTVHPTVDFAIVNYDKQEVLLARKSNEELLRFPGGFADTNTPSYEVDVLREAREETGLEFTEEPIYIGSTLVDDWRYRSEQNKIKTLMFVVEYTGGVPKADDDIADVRWAKLLSIGMYDIVPPHRVLMDILRKWWCKRALKIAVS